MFSVLPDLTPRDSHSLWYTSSRNPHLNPSHLDPNNDNTFPGGGGNGQPGGPNQINGLRNNRPQAQQAAIDRSVLGRLRADELYMERRRANVGNLGSTWLKPPGVNKTLFQLREERREAEEHAEQVRRDMLAAELAAAEAAEREAAEGGDPMALEGGLMDGGDPMMMMDDGEEENGDGEGGRDLDDDIPDADEGGFGYDGTSDSDEDETSEEDEEDEDANRMAAMRANEDRMREMLATRGTASHRHQSGEAVGYGADEEIDEEDQADILEEDDLQQGGYREIGPGIEDDLDMDANLDDDIPEAGSLGGYEHTDSEAELSSDEDQDISYAMPGTSASASRQQQLNRNPAPRISSSGPYALPPHPRQQQEYRQGQHRSSLASRADGNMGGQRSSLDISGLLSRDGSSVIGSSPRMRRLN